MPGINSVEQLREKVLGISCFGASSDTLGRAVLHRYKLNPNQDVKILALGGGTNRVAAMTHAYWTFVDRYELSPPDIAERPT